MVLARSLVAVAATIALPLSAALAAEETAHELAPYSAIVIEPFTVDRNPATEEFPRGLEIITQSKLVQELRRKALFTEVIESTTKTAGDSAATAAPAAFDTTRAAATPAVTDSASAVATPPSKGTGKRVSVATTILIFDKGSRAARYLGGMGAGQTRLKARFVFKDAETGAEVLRFDREGTFKGMFSAFGGSADAASAGVANGLVKGAVQEMARHR